MLDILRKATPVFLFKHILLDWRIQWAFLISTAVPNRVLTDFFFVISTGLTGFCGSFSSNWNLHHVFHDFGDVGWILAFWANKRTWRVVEKGNNRFYVLHRHGCRCTHYKVLDASYFAFLPATCGHVASFQVILDTCLAWNSSHTAGVESLRELQEIANILLEMALNKKMIHVKSIRRPFEFYIDIIFPKYQNKLKPKDVLVGFNGI